MIIKVLGPGCTNCKNLERVTRQAVDALGLDATIEKVADYPTIVGLRRHVHPRPGRRREGRRLRAGPHSRPAPRTPRPPSSMNSRVTVG